MRRQGCRAERGRVRQRRQRPASNGREQRATFGRKLREPIGDERVRARWQEAMERKRSLINQELRGSLWILGTIGSASPFIGLFGTVVGILGAFHNMASSGSGGFAVVASAISEALIATAAGIVVAVIAVLAYNAFQTRWSALVLNVRIQAEELAEMLEGLAASPASREKT